jgi:RHS repeat-associated protein
VRAAPPRHNLVVGITDQTSSTGVDQYQDSYNPFGVQTVDKLTTSAPVNPFGFTGAYQDPTLSGSLDMGARIYTPANATFTTRDPIQNRPDTEYSSDYAYADDAPTYEADPTGDTPACSIQG